MNNFIKRSILIYCGTGVKMIRCIFIKNQNTRFDGSEVNKFSFAENIDTNIK